MPHGGNLRIERGRAEIVKGGGRGTGSDFTDQRLEAGQHVDAAGLADRHEPLAGLHLVGDEGLEIGGKAGFERQTRSRRTGADGDGECGARTEAFRRRIVPARRRGKKSAPLVHGFEVTLGRTGKRFGQLCEPREIACKIASPDMQRRSVSRAPVRHVTAYAATHPQEDFAETFRFYVTRRGRMRELFAELGRKRKDVAKKEKYEPTPREHALLEAYLPPLVITAVVGQ